MKQYIILFFWLPVVTCLQSCGNLDSGNNEKQDALPAPAMIPYTLIKSYPHDTGSFTQGLEFHKGILYESTGNPDNVPHNGSWIGTINLSTGQSEKHVLLSRDFFGEGITLLNDRIYRLTWQNQKAFVYQLKDFSPLRELFYQGEGWGLTNDGKHLIMSNGSNILSFRDPDTFKEIRQISVHDNSGMKNNLNELEFINGYVFANVWQTHQILKIDTAGGAVMGVLDLSELVRQDTRLSSPPTDVLNGMAWNKDKQTLFVTGKKWPLYFELKIH